MGEPKSKDRGPITQAMEILLCGGWNEYCSISAMPCFRGSGGRCCRDAYIVIALLLSVACFVGWTYITPFRGVFAGWAAYRSLDLLFALTAQGFFGRIRRDKGIKDLCEGQLERLLVAVLFNYVELLFTFSVAYLWLDQRVPNSFSEPIRCLRQAFFVSISTMTTVGYGDIAPLKGWALGLCTIQAMLGVIVFVIFVGSVLARIRNSVSPKKDDDSHYRWWQYPLPLLILAAPIAVFYGIT